MSLRQACEKLLEEFPEFEWKKYDHGGCKTESWSPGGSMIQTETVAAIKEALDKEANKGDRVLIIALAMRALARRVLEYDAILMGHKEASHMLPSPYEAMVSQAKAMPEDPLEALPELGPLHQLLDYLDECQIAAADSIEDGATTFEVEVEEIARLKQEVIDSFGLEYRRKA
jgi:hypothetical protein